MVKVKNRSTLRHLTMQFMRMNRGRNLIAVFAIALTTLLFTSLFTGTSSMLLTKMKADMKACYTWSDGFAQDLTEEELSRAVEAIGFDREIARYGTGIFLGAAKDARFPFVLEVRAADEYTAEGWGCVPTVGNLPFKDNEIAMSTVVLDTLGIPRAIGTRITLSVELDPNTEKCRADTFILSGYWEGDKTDTNQIAWVSFAYADSNAYPVTHEDMENGAFNGSYTCSIWFQNLWNAGKKISALNESSGLLDRCFRLNPAYDYYTGEDSFSFGTVFALVVVILLAGFLIIYNIFSISVKTDLRTYGLLKNVGTTGRQLKRIVRMQALWLSVAGIPIGLVLGYGCGLVLAPTITQNMETNGNVSVVTTANPVIFLAAACFALFTVYLSCMQSCRMVEHVSPVEALRVAENEQTHRKSKKNFSVSWWGMAIQNMIRNWKKGLVVMLSISLSLVTLNGIAILVNGFDFDSYASISLSSDFELSKITSSREFANFSGITPDIQTLLDDCPGEAEIGYIFYSKEEITMEPELYAAWEQVMEQSYDNLGGAKEVWDNVEGSGRISVHFWGLSESAFRKLEWEGNACTWEEFQSGDVVVVTDYPTRFALSEFYYQPGDSFTMEFTDGSQKNYQVLGCAAMPYSLAYPYYDPISL